MKEIKQIVIYSETSGDTTLELVVEKEFSDIDLKMYECLFKRLNNNVVDSKNLIFELSFEELMVTDSTETRTSLERLLSHRIKITNDKKLQFIYNTVFVRLKINYEEKFITLEIWFSSYPILLAISQKLSIYNLDLRQIN